MVRLMRAYLSQPYEFHLRQNSASLVSTVLEATSYYSQATLTGSMRLLADGVMLLAILSLLTATNATAVLLLMGLCGLLFIIYDGLIKRRTHHAGEQAESL